LALCLGITSIRYAFDGRFEIASILVILASFLDGIDGRVARFLGHASDFGAHLDSLADIVNFGICPAIIVYLWSLNDISYRGIGWAVVLVYVSCGALRLARFNTSITNDSINMINMNTKDGKDSKGQNNAKDLSKHKRNFFIGLPIPAAAILVLTPLMFTFKIFPSYQFSPIFIAFYTVIVGLSMVSSMPIFAGKYVKIAPKYVLFVKILAWSLAVLIIIEPWLVIPIFVILYVISVPFFACYYYIRLRKLHLLSDVVNAHIH
jgi:CDP-diacylglycerol---serine O-phosphatidyltransferase